MLRKAKKRGFPTILAWLQKLSSLKDHDIGEQEVLFFDRLAFERHDYSHNSLKIGFSLWILKGNNHLDNNVQITKKRNENVNDYKTKSWQQQGSSLHPSMQENKDVKIQINNFKDLKKMTTLLLIERQDGGVIRSSRETCRILRLRRLHHGKIPLGNGSHGGGISRNMMNSEWELF